MQDELHSADGHRWPSTLVMAITVVLLVSALTWRESRGHHNPSSPSRAAAATTHDRATAPPTVLMNRLISPCDEVQDCLGKDTYRLHLHVAVTFTLPLGWSSTSYDAASADFFSDSKGYGVSVLEDVVAATPSSHLRPGPTSGGIDAHSVARWLASRPFLVASPVTRTMLSGLPAWQVDVRLKPGPSSAARCTRGGSLPCIPLLLMEPSRPRAAGIWGSERIRWILLDLAGGGITAVSTWDFTDRLDMLSPAQPLIASIQFVEFR
jgi:hypothetical protein